MRSWSEVVRAAWVFLPGVSHVLSPSLPVHALTPVYLYKSRR